MLKLLPAKQLCYLEMVCEHPDERPSREKRIDRPEAAFADAITNELSQDFVVFDYVRFEEPLGEFVLFQRAIKQETSQLHASIQDFLRDGNECFTIAQTGVEVLPQTFLRPATLDDVLDHRPVKIFLGWEMPENQGFVDAGMFGEFAGCSAFKTFGRKQFPSDPDNLQAPIFRRYSCVRSHSK